jgi:hypothetical protein
MFYLSESLRIRLNSVVRRVLDEGEIVLMMQLPQGMMLILNVVNGRALFFLNFSGHGLDSAPLVLPIACRTLRVDDIA